jgi:N-acetylglutamate synthase-like GNAT family acetyltransferase
MAYQVSLGGGYVVSDERARLDIDLIHDFLSQESYWSRGISRKTFERAAANSLCLGLYDSGGDQAGFARVVSDLAGFAWLTDVFVLSAHRGRGLGKALVRAVLAHPDLAGLKRWLLATHDAQRFYAGLGFAPLDDPAIFMTISHPPPGGTS